MWPISAGRSTDGDHELLRRQPQLHRLAASVSTERLVTELEATAFHEAGHTVVGIAVGLSVEFVDIIPNHPAGRTGHTRYHMPAWIDAANLTPISRAYFEARVCATWGGPMAEERRTGFVHLPDRIERWHREPRFLCDTALLLSDTPGVFLQDTSDRADAILTAQWERVEVVAAALLDRTTLTGAEVAHLLSDQGATIASMLPRGHPRMTSALRP
jgi:hypothetical protein